MSAETKDVVDAIYRHQNPEDCSKAKYYIVPPCELLAAAVGGVAGAGPPCRQASGFFLNNRMHSLTLSSNTHHPGNHGMSAGMRTYSWILAGAFLQDRVAIFPPFARPGKDDPYVARKEFAPVRPTGKALPFATHTHKHNQSTILDCAPPPPTRNPTQMAVDGRPVLRQPHPDPGLLL